MPEITITTANWAEALDAKYRYIFIKGGRSSGKSWEVANYLVLRSLTEKDLKIVGLREVQKSIEKSSKSLVDDTLKRLGVSHLYKSIQAEVRKEINDDNGLFYFQGMNDLTADNIKSLEGFKIAWFEEAQNASRKTLKTLRPTIRMEGSQIIFTWNPQHPDDAIEQFCNEMAGEPDCLVIHVNYEDNPFLTEVSKREIDIDKRNAPDDFDHIWLGGYDTSFHGHYYAKLLDEAQQDGRITNVPKKAGCDIVNVWDLGRSDATAIWVYQIVGLQVRFIDYMQGNFEDLDYYADWIKKNNYNEYCYLPHDAKHKRLGQKGSIKDQLSNMGINNIKVLPASSVDATRRLAKTLLKECYIDKEKCADGIHVLRKERAEKDERTGKWKEIHEQDGAAAFRYAAMSIEQKHPKPPTPSDDYIPSSTSWMA